MQFKPYICVEFDNILLTGLGKLKTEEIIQLSIVILIVVVGQHGGLITLPRIADMYESLGRFLKDLGLLNQVCSVVQFSHCISSISDNYISCKRSLGGILVSPCTSVPSVGLICQEYV